MSAMFKKILVPTDGSPLSEKAITAAVDFAKETGGTLVGLAVADHEVPAAMYEGSGAPPSLTGYEAKARTLGQAHVDKIKGLADVANVPCETVVALSTTPYREIINTANQYGCDIIFMASHGRSGLGSLLIGSETQKVLSHSTIPVLVYR
jgi:nucleotide-binding universal stress UspA family protein